MEFDVTLKEQDMVRFNLYHTYSRISSWFAVALAVVALLVSVKTYGKVSGTVTAIYILIALLILIYIPLNTMLSAKRRIRLMPELLAPLHYQITDEGIRVSKEDEAAEISWDKIFRIVGVQTAVYIYTSRIYAYVVPKEVLGDQLETFRKLASDHLEARRVKL